MLKNYRKHDNPQNYLHIIEEAIDVEEKTYELILCHFSCIIKLKNNCPSVFCNLDKQSCSEVIHGRKHGSDEMMNSCFSKHLPCFCNELQTS